MRIAIINWSRRKAGGVETYLGNIIPALLSAGHTVAFWHEVDQPANRDAIPLPEGVQAWSVAELGAERALTALRDWRPDLLYAHGLLNPKLEAAVLEIAPAVFFAHNYYGTCISGAKTFKRPVVTPCHRRFGRQCLGQFYPRRCGGLSPVTMLREYRRQSQRLALLPRYRAIVTHSRYMHEEYLKHGLDPGRIHSFPYFTNHGGDGTQWPAQLLSRHDTVSAGAAAELLATQDARLDKRQVHHLLFLGRMSLLKGGHVLLDALPQAAASLTKPLRVTFAGDGPKRKQWERKAARLQARITNLRIEFVGWIGGQGRDVLLDDCDLLLVPSLWPEPFGLVGPEAGLHSVPVVAFAVGGITEWLFEGVNGCLAPGDPPTAGGLAEAISRCLRDPIKHARLRLGAAEVAQEFQLKNHMAGLIKVFEEIAWTRQSAYA